MTNPKNLRTDIFSPRGPARWTTSYALIDGEVYSVNVKYDVTSSDHYAHKSGDLRVGIVTGIKWKVIDSGRKAWLLGILSDAAASREFRDTKPTIASWIAIP